MTRVVADTNIYISALMFGGNPGFFLDLAMRRAFTLVSSPAILDELDEKLREKFAVSEADARLIRAKLEGVVHLAKPGFSLRVVRDDPDEDRILECAVAGKANCIVSGDRHLLRLASYEGMPILTAREFLSKTGAL
ncbi:MAG TPA: putative toxin-antitoxin system toxin component, PIN family [Acidobacteriaceae bacterium]|nr:putative toxin-antitoxin system toxin component, PIN family [Acidobacteriaceae bacterium]